MKDVWHVFWLVMGSFLGAYVSVAATMHFNKAFAAETKSVHQLVSYGLVSCSVGLFITTELILHAWPPLAYSKTFMMAGAVATTSWIVLAAVFSEWFSKGLVACFLFFIPSGLRDRFKLPGDGDKKP